MRAHVSDLVPAPAAGTLEQVPASLSERLEWLCRFGLPRVSRLEQGWYAVIAMNTTAIGASFDVKSDFSHKSPDAAVAQLIERMLAALAAIQGVRHA